MVLGWCIASFGRIRRKKMKRSIFTVASLIGAGFVPFTASANEENDKGISEEGSFLDNLRQIVSEIRGNHEYTLAAHSSHVSHASHASHASHSSYLSPQPPQPEVPPYVTGTEPGDVMGRNLDSTPLSSVLPSTLAVAKKLKVLPGNSEKFKTLVVEVQLALISRGHDVGSVDGELDAQTVAAIYDYQDGSGLIPSGKLTNEVMDSLGIVAQ
jgi:His-Xaa-Ser repeat protein HxsA